MSSSRTMQLTKCTVWVVALIGLQHLIPPPWAVSLGRAPSAWPFLDEWNPSIHVWNAERTQLLRRERMRARGLITEIWTVPWELVATCWPHHMADTVVNYSLYLWGTVEEVLVGRALGCRFKHRCTNTVMSSANTPPNTDPSSLICSLP